MTVAERAVATQPLTGVRLLDLTNGWSGPLGTRMLADHGAEVIRVESVHYYDFLRGLRNPPAGSAGKWPKGDPGERPWERNPFFNETNRNKRGVTIHLPAADGVDLIKRLAAECDVIVTSFRPGVLEKYGLTTKEFENLRPDIIIVNLSVWGRGGPDERYAGYAPAMEAVAGYHEMTGYLGGPPMLSNSNFGDPISGIYATLAIVGALDFRRRTGQGQFINYSQREGLLCHLGDALMDYQLNRRNPSRLGNRHPIFAPQGCYPCRGDDKWISISIRNDAEWTAFCKVMQLSELAEDPRFTDTNGRQANHDELDDLIGKATQHRDNYDLMHQLQRCGIPSAPVADIAEIFHEPQLRSRGFFQSMTKEWCGTEEYPGFPIKLSRTPGSITRATPRLGEDNEYVFREILGMNDEELMALSDKQVIGDYPMPGADGVG